MEPPPAANGAPGSSVSPTAAPAATAPAAPDLGSTRVPRAKKDSQTADTKTTSGINGGGGGGSSALPQKSPKKKRKKSSSGTTTTTKTTTPKPKQRHRRLANGKHHNYPVPSPADCRWTRNAEQFEEARAKETQHTTPAPSPLPTSMLVEAEPPSPGASPSADLPATCTAMATRGVGGTTARLKPRRPWEWSKEDCAAVAKDAIFSLSGFTGAGSANETGGGGVSLLVGAGGATLFSDSDGGDEDATSGDEQEEQEEEEKHGSANRKRVNGSSSGSGNGNSNGSTWPSCDGDGVGGAGRRVRARPAFSRKAAGKGEGEGTPMEPPLDTPCSNVSVSNITAPTLVPADAATPQDHGEPPSSRAGRRKGVPRATPRAGQPGQGRKSRRPSGCGSASPDGAAAPHPHPRPGISSAVVVDDDERKARELSAKLNRNSPRGASLPAAALQPGAVQLSTERPRSVTVTVAPASTASTRIAAEATSRPPAAAKRSSGSKCNRGVSGPSFGEKKEKEKKKKKKPSPPKKAASGGAAEKEASAGSAGEGAGDPWAESGLFFGAGTTAEILWDDCKWYRCCISSVSAEGKCGVFEFLPYKKITRGRVYTNVLDFEKWFSDGRIALPETNLRWD